MCESKRVSARVFDGRRHCSPTAAAAAAAAAATDTSSVCGCMCGGELSDVTS